MQNVFIIKGMNRIVTVMPFYDVAKAVSLR